MQFIHFCGKGFVIKCNGEESECILPYFGLDVATMWLSYFAKKKIKKNVWIIRVWWSTPNNHSLRQALEQCILHVLPSEL